MVRGRSPCHGRRQIRSVAPRTLRFTPTTTSARRPLNERATSASSAHRSSFQATRNTLRSNSTCVTTQKRIPTSMYWLTTDSSFDSRTSPREDTEVCPGGGVRGRIHDGRAAALSASLSPQQQHQLFRGHVCVGGIVKRAATRPHAPSRCRRKHDAIAIRIHARQLRDVRRCSTRRHLRCAGRQHRRAKREVAGAVVDKPRRERRQWGRGISHRADTRPVGALMPLRRHSAHL